MQTIRDKMSHIYEKYNEHQMVGKILLAVSCLLLCILPVFDPGRYFVRVTALICVYAILALGLNLVTGYLGQTVMGHAALFCVGAYTSALLSIATNCNFFVAIIAGIIGGLFAGLLLGITTMKLTGSYFAITTLGFAEVVKMIALNWISVTNGPLGVKGIPSPTLFGLELTSSNYGLYWLSLALLGVAIVFCVLLISSKFGRAIIAIREDRLAAQMMGIRVIRYQIATIVIAGGLAGLAGTLYAHMNQYIDPNSFTFDISTIILSIVIFGGMGTIRGMVFGSIVLISFPELLRSFSEYRFIVYGLILIVMMRFRPQGLLGGLSKRPYSLPKGVCVVHENASKGTNERSITAESE